MLLLITCHIAHNPTKSISFCAMKRIGEKIVYFIREEIRYNNTSYKCNLSIKDIPKIEYTQNHTNTIFFLK